jgi:predicted PolB exonuclease-like 3'-5' exonuclease
VDLDNDEHLDVCQNIEVGLKEQYELHEDLTDTLCVFALEAAKTAVKQRFGYAKNEKVTDHPLAQGIIAWCVSVGVERVDKVNNLTLKDYLNRVDKIKRSVKRHSSMGSRAYYEFIKNYV